jgi:predicted KAP-like P-loop ATPase
MWPDNETDQDFLNFSGVAETVAEIIVQAEKQPISIGVSGAWGVGKSSMIKLIHKELTKRKPGEKAFVFVNFNPWLYQGYDDARAALMDVIGTALAKEVDDRKTGVEKTKAFLKRLNWFRALKLGASAAAVAAGLPPVMLVGDAVELAKKIVAGEIATEEADKIAAAAEKLGGAGTGLLGPKEIPSPPKEIHALREHFEKALEELGITLVVLIDDLDRCLPETTISTLEAIRLFLFIKNTAFVIAADDAMIKHAVRRHFEGINDEQIVTNYFDKLIQVPIRVPPLGTQEVRAYMMLLYIENSDTGQGAKERIRAKVCEQLGKTWQGQRVDSAFIQSLKETLSADVVSRLDTADRLAVIMATASGISGNPRLIKRFLNVLAIRKTIARAHGVGINDAVLAKMHLFERCGDPKAYAALAKAVTEDTEGKPRFLAEWEEQVGTTNQPKRAAPWDAQFVDEWLALPPHLGDQDLRGILYVSREHAPLLSPEDRLSSEGIELLGALTTAPEVAETLRSRLSAIPRPDLQIIMGRLLDRAHQEQEWGVPPILNACLLVSDIDLTQAERLAGFLSERPVSQIKPSIVPKIGGRPWAKGVFDKWDKLEVDKSVKNAIKKTKDHGDISVK